MTIKLSFFIVVLVCTALLCATAIADRIILKDGTIEQSDRIWESQDYYHFILKGTKNVEIRYAKTIVDRIERDQSGQNTGKSISSPTQTRSGTEKDLGDKSRNSKILTTEGPGLSVDPMKLPEEKIIKENHGLPFYDPRRPNRYWVTRQSQHNKLKNALDAISVLYGRPPQWVEKYMGESNDLGIIHHNLIAQMKKEQSEVQSKHTKTHANASVEVKLDSPHGVSKGIKPAAVFRQPDVGQGIRFYDPRRSEKYWSGQMTHHNTLQEAIQALADHYQVPEQWVADHLGETNDLAQIHRNIQKSLSAFLPPSGG